MKKILSLVLTLFISSFVYAAPAEQNKVNMPPEPPHKHQQQFKQDFEKIAKELKITEEQKQKINELMQADLNKKHELRQQIKQKSYDLDNEIQKEKVDMNAVNNLTKEIQQLNANLAKINIDSKLNVRNILSYEQYSKLEQARKQAMEHFKQEKAKQK